MSFEEYHDEFTNHHIRPRNDMLKSQSGARCSPRPSNDDARGLLDHHADAIELLPMTRAESTKYQDEIPQSKFKFFPKFKGWRGGAILFALGALISLIIAVGVGYFIPIPTENGMGQIWAGDCRIVGRYNTLIHLGVNAMSTLLLSGSNYCMQCLTAPTRKEIERAHSKGKWLDIGIQSVRNLGSVSLYKVGLWGLLVLSSVPLHLIYNSIFFSSIPANDYIVYVVTESFWDSTNITEVDWVTDGSYNRNNPRPDNATAHLNKIKNIQDNSSDANSTQFNFGTFETLSNKECIEAYAVPLLNGRRTLVITTTNKTSRPYAHGYRYYSPDHVQPSGGIYEPYSWIYDGNDSDCYTKINNLTDSPNEWRPFGFLAKECLSEVVKEECSLNIGQPIIIGIVVCNIVKFLIMAVVALGLRDRPLITLGDAVESFLDDQDSTTRGLCIVSKKHLVFNKREFGSGADKLSIKPMAARNRRHYWAEAGSKRRWTWTLSILGLSVFAVIIFLGLGVDYMTFLSSTPPFSIGFGEANPAAVITGERKTWAPLQYKNYGHQIMVASIIANIPQMAFSALSFALNSLLTTIYIAKEWNSYSEHRKPLRVSNPRQGQRSTYFLQLPYRIAVPFNVISSIIHWLISQSIFLVVFSNNDSWGRLANPIQTVTCGYSPLPMVLLLVTGVILFLGLCLFWTFPFRSAMPLVGTCSAAISAACHYPNDKDAALKPLRWGAVTQGGTVPEEGVGHCSFASGSVKKPLIKRLYAGTIDT